jgi:hypothetical protein
MEANPPVHGTTINGGHWWPYPGFNQARDRMAAAASSLTLQCGRDRGRWTPWLPAWASSSSSHEPPNAMRFDPTQSRRQGKLVLQTYSEGNDRGRAGDGGAVRSALGDGEDGLWWCSGFEEELYSFTLLPSCSSLVQLLRMSMNRARAAAIFVR